MKYYGLFKNNELIKANIIPIEAVGFETKEITQNEYETFKTKQNLQLEQQNKLNELTNWFVNYYTKNEQKYRRLHTLGLKCDDENEPIEKLKQLYREAEEKRKEIQRLEQGGNENGTLYDNTL